MNQSQQEYSIILKNIIFLADQCKKDTPGKRNLLNKWFQDSIKSYILESVASPLIIQHLQFSSQEDLRAFIRKQADKSKPKYMGIIELYFVYINQSNKQDQFVQNLKQILKNPVDITQQNKQQTYNINKTIRKQFVCYLLLKYFEIFEEQKVPSFFELWNICFPQNKQEKKKLSKFDKEAQIQKQNIKHEIENNENNITHNESMSQLYLQFNTYNDYAYDCDSYLYNHNVFQQNESREQRNNDIINNQSYQMDSCDQFFEFNQNIVLNPSFSLF